MYDKKQALGFILIIMVVMTYTQLQFSQRQKNQNPAIVQPEASQNAINTAAPALPSNIVSQNLPANPSPISNVAGFSSKIPSLDEIAQAPQVVVHSSSSTMVITQLGARVKSLELNKIKKDLKGDDLFNLIYTQEGLSLPAGLEQGPLSDVALNYQIKELSGFEKQSDGSLNVAGSNTASLTLSAQAPSGQIFNKTFSFKANSYLFNISASISPANDNSADLTLSWPFHVDPALLHQRYDPYFFSVLYDSNKVRHFQAVSDLTELGNIQSAQWLAFGDRYFGTALLPSNKQHNLHVQASNGLFVLFAHGNKSELSVDVYSGPKVYEQLVSQNLQLERTIDLGFFSFVAYPLLQLLKLLFSIFGNYGVAIVALTLLVKNIFYPLNKASLKSMRAMQELSPEIAALKERVKDPTKLNQETLALYKRKGVNPVGGCLPVFIQIPVFFGLYTALQNAVELRHAPFALWVKDLAQKETLEFFGINFPIMVLTMGTIMFVQQYRTPMPNVDPAQRKVMLGMSLMFTVMFLIFPFPAGLALYMLVNTTISLVQQQCIKSVTMNKPYQMTLLASVAILLTAFIFSKI